MTKCTALILYLFVLCIFCNLPVNAQEKDAALHYHSNVVDTIFGTPVPDPYRWLEAENSDMVMQWLKQQQKITKAEGKKLEDKYKEISDETSEYGGNSYLKLEKKGPYYFRMLYDVNKFFNTVSVARVLYYREKIEDEDRVAYDPSDYSMNDPYLITGYSPSGDGEYLAVSLAKSGSARNTVRVKNLRQKLNLKDKLEGVRSSPIVWWRDGFFYRKFNTSSPGLKTDSAQQLRYHQLGHPQESDQLIYTIPDLEHEVFRYSLSSDGRYLVLETALKSKDEWDNIIAYKDLNEGLYAELNLLVSVPRAEDDDFNFIDVINGGFAVLTNYNAPTYKVVLFSKDTLNHGTDLIMPFKNFLRSVHHFGHKLLAVYFNEGLYTTAVFNYDGQLLTRIKFDTGVYVHDFSGQPDNDEVLFYKSSYYTPDVFCTLDLKSYEIYFVGKTTVSYDAGLYTTSIVNYKSNDGTEMPMYVTCKKGIKLDGNNPLILNGYGAFGVKTLPLVQFSNIIFFNNGGILAEPMIRGGGDFGKEWHQAGKLLNKQHSIDDFISAAEYLISAGYTSKEKLIIKSFGGALIGAMITQRPDLFKIAISRSGLYDMLRYPLFTGGAFWAEEYGITSDEAQFRNLLKYSPLHNVKSSVNYPSTLLFAGPNTGRSSLLHTYKFLTALQRNSSGANPHIMYFSEDAQNGATNFADYFRESAFELAFIFTELNMKLNTNIK